MYTLYAWSLSLIPGLLYIGLRLWRGSQSRSWNWEKVVFFLLWIVPFGAFYVLVHMGQQGQVFVFLPALLVISAAGLVRLLVRWPRWLIVTVVVLAMANMLIFCLAPEYPLGGDRFRLLTRDTLLSSDRYYQDRFRVIEEHFPPASTAVLAAGWHRVEYYLPEYTILPFGVVSKWEQDEGSPRGSSQETTDTPVGLGLELDSRGQAAIVILDPYLMLFSESSASVHGLPLAHGGELEYFVLTEDQVFHLGPDSFGVGEN
jgi:hypothetical protein